MQQRHASLFNCENKLLFGEPAVRNVKRAPVTATESLGL
jgi:hypothetical protein